MVFLDILVEDIILKILLFFDVPTILSISQTCQYLHNLAFSRSIWVKFLSDINSRLPLDIPDGQSLDSLSTSALIALAKMAVVGPQSWPPIAANGPVVSRRLSINTNEKRISGRLSPKIVPGGRYLLVLVDDNLECRRTSDGMCMWTYDSKGTNPSDTSLIVTFDVDLEKEGQGINIIVGIDAKPSRIELIHLDPSIWVSSVLFTFRTSPRHIDTYRRSRIRGNIAMVCAEYDSNFVLIDLNLQSALLMPTAFVPMHIDIIPGNFLVLCMSPHSNNYKIAVWHTKSLEPYWSFVGGTRSDSIVIERLNISPPPTETIIVPSSSSHGYPAKLAAHEHPLYPGLYTLWVCLSRPLPYPASPSVSAYPVHVCKYRISLHPVSRQCSIHPLHSRPIHVAHLYNEVGSAGISFAGHTTSDWCSSLVGTGMELPRQDYLISLDPDPKSGGLQGGALDFLHFSYLVVHVSPYSGTLWHLDETQGALVVEYYQ